MKKSFITIILFLFHTLGVWAQARSETIVLATDKSVYGSYDTLYVSGMIISPDAATSSELSNYCVVELFNERDTIVERKKVRCEGNTFHVRFPLGDIRGNQYLLVRAYTRFMRNFSERTWPITVAGIAESGKKPLIPSLRSLEKGSLQLVYSKGVILYKYMAQEPTDETYHLNFYSGGCRLGAVDMPVDHREGSFIPDSVTGDLICGLLTDGKNEIVASRFLPLNKVTQGDIAEMGAFSYEKNGPIQLTLNKQDCDMSYLLRIEKKEDDLFSLLPAAMWRFFQIGAEDLGKIWERTYSYDYAPEHVLSIQGVVKTERGGLFTDGGTVVAFNNETGHTYEGDIDASGHFVVGVDDFKDGDTFFLQAYNKKGKNNFYTLEPCDESLPLIYLPDVTLVDGGEYSFPPSSVTVDTMCIHELSEVKITASYVNKEALSQKFYHTNYFDYDEIKKRNYVKLEDILRAMQGIVVKGGEVTRTRGTSRLKGESQSIPFHVDGAWVEFEKDQSGHVNNDLYSVPPYFLETVVTVSDIATIEYIPSPRSVTLYGPKAFEGVIVVTTRSGKDKDNTIIPSKGLNYMMTGLSDNRPFPEKIRLHSLVLPEGETRTVSFVAPSEAGNYRFVVEGIGKNHRTVCKVLDIEVK